MYTFRLVVERDHLDAEHPEDNGVEVGRVDPHPGGVDAHQVLLRVAAKQQNQLLQGVFNKKHRK